MPSGLVRQQDSHCLVELVLENIKLESSLFAGLLCPWLLQKRCGISTNMPYVSEQNRYAKTRTLNFSML